MNQISSVWLNNQDAYFLACGSSNPWSQEKNLEKCNYRTSDCEITSIGPERPWISEHRTMGNKIKNQIILFSVLGEVLPGVINDMVCTNRAHNNQLSGVIHPGHLSP